jgi:hypothetical protein
MTVSATSVRFDEHTMWVELADGRTLGIPLAWFPRLLRASPAQREQVEVSGTGLHWEAINEDISIAGLLAGRPMTHVRRCVTSRQLESDDTIPSKK